MKHKDSVKLFLSIVREHIDLIESGEGRVVVPDVGDITYRTVGNKHFHVIPEFFIQHSGASLMEFPYGEKKFYAGDLFIIPRGLPHYEHAKKYKGKEFTNLVGAFDGDFLESHIAGQGENNRPSIFGWAKFKDKLKMISSMVSCLDTIIQLSLSPKKSRAIKTAINSFGAGFLNLFYDFIKNSNDRQDEEPYKVMLCRHMVADRISDPSLNVSSLAHDIKCAPDYLSHLFKTETGWSLIEYINDNRIKRAVYLLSSSAMNISEVARACGYSDSAYFSRKFSQVTNISPREYRKKRR